MEHVCKEMKQAMLWEGMTVHVEPTVNGQNWLLYIDDDRESSLLSFPLSIKLCPWCGLRLEPLIQAVQWNNIENRFDETGRINYLFAR